MRVRRGFLFWGLVLLPLGAIPLLVRAGQLDANRLADAWRFWPLIVIGLGLLVLASRTRLAVIGVAVIALTIGSIGGAALAGGSLWFGGCGLGGSGEAGQLDRTGTLTGRATVRLELNCGSIDVATAAGPGWTFHATYRGTAPIVDSTPDRIDVRLPNGESHRSQEWQLRLPAEALGTLNVTANAGTSTLNLAGATLDELSAAINAGDVRIPAADAAIKHLDLTMNAGRVRLALGSGATSGSISVNAGAVDLCVPPTVGLRLDVEDQLTFTTNLGSRGLAKDGNVWTRGTQGGGDVIDLSVEGNAASFTLDPNGGC